MKAFSERFLLMFAAAALVVSPPHLSAEDWVTLQVERAPGPAGPWIQVDLDEFPKDEHGNPRIPVDNPKEFYRTRIELGPAVRIGDSIPLLEVPEDAVAIAKEHLAKKLAGDPTRDNTDPEGWPDGAQLAPRVHPQFVVAGDGSVKPGYFEFKVLLPATPPVRGRGPTVSDPSEERPADLGYILVSASNEDFPIAEFATSGPTPHEEMARIAGTPRFNLVRYGPTFRAAEDAQGNLIANLGATPFKLDANVLELNGAEWKGDSRTGLDQNPVRLPRLEVAHYESYLAFKADFATSPVYAKLRENRKARAKWEWNVRSGRGPEGMNIVIDEPVTILPGLDGIEYSFVGESTDPILSVAPDPKGGLVLRGQKPGEGMLYVKRGANEYLFSIVISTRVGTRAYGDVVETGYWYAGAWGNQPRYHQLKRDRWCDLVGCGPVAWAMLFAWYDLNWGVEYAFNGEGSGSPPWDMSTSSNRSKVIPIYDDLHELCDVICNPFGDDGATYPTDMTDGFKSYTFVFANAGLLGRAWTINSVTGTWPDAGALRSRDAIKKGYPAVTGLGWMWHYVLAYGYCYEKIETTPGHTYTVRYLKCNMGWNGSGPAWYNLADTFYSADCELWD